MSVNITKEGATGTGTQTLNFSFGQNSSRLAVEKTFYLSPNGTNTLKVTQEAASLELSLTSSDTITVAEGTTSPVTFRGRANGRYIGASSPLVSITLVEYSSGSAHNIPVTETQSTVGVIGTIYDAAGSVSSFGEEYEFELTIPTIPSEDTYKIRIWTNDSNSSTTGAVSETVQLKVVQSGGGGSDDERVTGVSISINDPDATNLIGVGESVPFIATVTPANATIASVVWTSENGHFSISQDSSNPLECTITGTSQGSGIGGDKLIVTVTDTLGNQVSNWFGLTIKNPGTITVDDMSIRSLDEAAQGEVTLYNIDTSKGFTFQNVSESGWVSGGSSVLDYSNTPNSVSIKPISQNYTATEGRSAIFTVTGTDVLGNTVVSNRFTIYQEYGSVYPCTGMSISGITPVFNSGNSAVYTVTYLPSNTTQTHCTWSITDLNGNSVSSSIASLDTNNTNDSQAKVVVGPDADSTTIVLHAVNDDNNSISAQKQIVLTYYENPAVVITNITGSQVTLESYTTSDDTPRVSFTNCSLSSILSSSDKDDTPQASSIFDRTGLISLVEILNGQGQGTGVYKLVAPINQNNSYSSRTGYIEIHATDPDNTDVYVTVQYYQAGLQPTGNKFYFVSTSGNEPEVTAGISASELSFSVEWQNSATGGTVFYAPVWTLNLYQNASDTTPINSTPLTGTLSDVTVSTVYPATYTTNHNGIDLDGYYDNFSKIELTLRTSSVNGTAHYDTVRGSYWTDDE